MRWRQWRLLAMIGLVALALGGHAARAQGPASGKLVRSYCEGQAGGRPAWVEQALKRSLQYLATSDQARGLIEPAVDLALIGADQDDLGLTHVRFRQVRNGVPVFGGQVLTHLDASAVRSAGGRVFDASRVDTTPRIAAAQAVSTARAAHSYKGALANQPVASLVVLPNQDGTAGARLVYQVELLVEDGTDQTGRYRYFVDAGDASIVWSYNAMHSDGAVGTGHGLYSNPVSIGTFLTGGRYYLIDVTRGAMTTYTMRNQQSGRFALTDADNDWGTGTNADEDSAGVDAHFGAAKTWDYYLNRHGRRGIDGNGYRMFSRVHYGFRYNNAFWDGSVMTYGDGDGSLFSPLVSLDVAGHEITHGLTEFTADLIYARESGASNESYSDIFGTAVEWYTGPIGGRQPDYLIGEDVYTPGTAGDALRSMNNPASAGDPDHYSIRDYPNCQFPSGGNDNCGVHTNSGIQNNAFYLLAEGGTNATSGLSVTGIGRQPAENIFFRALVVYLTPSATFHDVRVATLSAAADLYGSGSAQYNSTASAWAAVGVQ